MPLLVTFMWKNLKRMRSLWKRTIITFALPVLIVTLATLLLHNIDRFHDPVPRDYFMEDVGMNFSEYDNIYAMQSAYFTPNSSEYLNLVSDLENPIGFRTEKELYNFLEKLDDVKYPAVFFKTHNPDKLRIDVRYGSIDLSKLYCDYLGDITHDDYKRKPPLYFMDYFSRKFMQEFNPTNKLPSFTMQPAPITDLDVQFRYSVQPRVFSIIVMLSILVVSTSLLIFPLVEEKQDGIKEILSIATSHSHWNQVSMFLLNVAVLASILFTILAISAGVPIFYKMSYVHPIILTLLFIPALIAYSSFLSTFFDTVTYASIGGAGFYIVPYALFLYLDFKSVFSRARIFFPMSMFQNGFEIYDGYMRAERIFDWSRIDSLSHPNNTRYTMLDIYVALMLTTIMYYCLYYYISNVFPGCRGTPQPYYFLFTRAFWCGPKKGDEFTSDTFEPIVQIQNLTKYFRRGTFSKKKVTAIDGISFNLDKNSITVLLGHNGAGKTTTMGMITGIVPPSSGRIVIDGDDRVKHYRTAIGYCPQLDVFISYMSCRDQVRFFGQLRGLSFRKAVVEANLILEKVKLTSSANLSANKLSSGMKRRLCLACAIIGQTKLVILDEPSSGLDPESRRDLWTVLLELRKERAILLSTHSMEEAGVLGDKVIIMDHGKILCEGTQFQLKKLYGTGYSLKILMRDNFKMAETLSRIHKSIPEAKIKSNIYPTLSIAMPYSAVSLFPVALVELECNKQRLGIESLSVANTTMEEVFINSAASNRNQFQNIVETVNFRELDNHKFDLCKCTLWRRQVLAIWYKKALFMLRSSFRFMVQALFPIAFIALTYFAATKENPTGSGQIFKVTTDMIRDGNVYLAINSTVKDHERVIDIFKRIAKRDKNKVVVLKDQSLFYAMHEKMKKNRENYLDKTLAAIEVLEDEETQYSFKLMYQPYLKLSDFYTLNLMNNMIAELVLNKPDMFSYGIGQLRQSYESDVPMYVIMYPMIVPFGFVFFVTYFVTLVFMEEQSEFKMIQNISPAVYWLATFTFDSVFIVIFSGLYAWIASTFDTSDIISSYDIICLFLLFTLEGFVYILILYIFAKSFDKLSTVYSVIFYVMFPTSIAAIPYSNPVFCRNYPFIPYFMGLFPDFGLRYGISKVLLHEHFHFTDLLPLFIAISAEIVVLLAVLIFVYENIYVSTKFKTATSYFNPREWSCIRKWFSEKKPKDYADQFQPDAYVNLEKYHVQQILAANATQIYPLIVTELQKKYGKFHAVKGVNFAVEKGQCFGLLGMNGSGKSTIFKMMTLNNSITAGQITVKGYDSRNNVEHYQQQFGYCPEMSALLDFMTSYELLRYMAWIKGTPFSQLGSEAKQWLLRMDLMKYANVPISDYSGGTKRKLNTALSMIGSPSLIFMDEPTTGVDPVSRRFMWSCIKDFQAKQKTIVLTSQSMDECEELCNRLAIMNVGQFKCIGFIQKLKAMFGTGFTLLIKVRDNSSPQRLDQIKEEIKDVYECILRDDYAATLVFKVIEKNIVWSLIFYKIETFCRRFTDIVEDFAINEISLEDIFLQFKNTQ